MGEWDKLLATDMSVLTCSCRTCQAILQGHTSLVGQLQMRNSTLVTGGSDGSVRVWSLDTYSPIHRLAAHDNSVTSLQFDDLRVVSGGSDGRVKIWDLTTGSLVRELSQPAEAVWRVAFESERCVVMASRTGRTIMEVWDFTPPPEEDEHLGIRSGSAATGGFMPAGCHIAEDPAMPEFDEDRMDGLECKENEEMMDPYDQDDEDDMKENQPIM